LLKYSSSFYQVGKFCFKVYGDSTAYVSPEGSLRDNMRLYFKPDSDSNTGIFSSKG
jgi:hypothetical protein